MKKIGFLALSLAILVGIIASAPKIKSTINEIETDKENTAKYEEFLANNKVFFDNTFYNGVDISGLTPYEAVSAIEKDFESKSVQIVSDYPDDAQIFSFGRLNFDYNDLLKDLLSVYDAQTLTKEEFLTQAQRRDYSYDIAKDGDYSKMDLRNLKVLNPDTRIKSHDAYVSYDKISGKFIVENEVYGNELKEGTLEEKIEAALKNHESKVVISPDDYVKPEITSDDKKLNQVIEYYKILLGKSLVVNVSGNTITLGPDKLLSLYEFGPDDVINEEALTSFVASLAGTYNTFGMDRPFTTSTQEQVIVHGGDYGWLINQEGTKEAIKKALLTSNSQEAVDAVYTRAGQRPSFAEIGNTYVEISLRDQKIWMYVNGVQIVNDDCTTGMFEDPACTTNEGTFSLTYKVTNVTLKGPTWNDYVYYWMPFDDQNGMHDATWRTDEEFGGQNRFGNGSHGCVNLRLNTAQVIYENIQPDTPIITW